MIAHLDHLPRLHEAGQLLVAGPTGGPRDAASAGSASSAAGRRRRGRLRRWIPGLHTADKRAIPRTNATSATATRQVSRSLRNAAAPNVAMTGYVPDTGPTRAAGPRS